MSSQPSNPELEETRRFWDQQAASFDQETDHGLVGPQVLAAWSGLLAERLPLEYPSILDIGCGTGSLSAVLAEQGHTVRGIDLSPAMIERARQKAAAKGLAIEFQVMDAAFPQFAPGQFDAILCRHLLWALPEPEQVLARWLKLLKPGGRLLLIEGFWGTGAGLHASQVQTLLPAAFENVRLIDLSPQPAFWGRLVSDERYALSADNT